MLEMFQRDICNDRRDRGTHGCIPQLFIEFLMEAEDSVWIVNFRSLMNFSVGILKTLVELLQVAILELITCNTRVAGMLVKRALTSNEIKVSPFGFIVRF